MKVAAYQAPLDACYSGDAIGLIREQITRCESIGVAILCCPEAMLGGLADYVDEPASIGIDVASGRLDGTLAPLASKRVTTILGFTEIGESGQLYNSAAVYSRGAVVGLYRKHHPAINTSVYSAGSETPVFTVDGLTFGIVICRDSVFAEPAGAMMSRGAAALFVPTNNGMLSAKGGAELVMHARGIDGRRAEAHGIAVIRADVVGHARGLASHGSSAIVDRSGTMVTAATPMEPNLLVADIETTRDGGHYH